jgi:hypothetical protein
MLVSAIIKQALRAAGVMDAGAEATPVQAAAALDALNGLQRSFFGMEVGPRLDAVSLTATGTGVYGALYQVKLAAPATLTLPDNPQDGWRVGVVDVAANFATHNLTVSPNNRRIATAIGTYATANQALSTNGVSKAWFYRADVGAWIEEADWVLTDTPYFPDAYHTALADILALVLFPQYETTPPAHLVNNAQRGRDIIMERYNPRALVSRARKGA